MSLYRKYRPQTFEDVVGQEHVARTLRNALTATPPRVAHAYLFTGPRGIGKTTNARLLAKCLNCENGPTPTPCNQCDFCTRVANNQPVMDLTEIDAASNTGVDNIREAIIDKVSMAPAEGRYRIYIIDEVHMLSNNAFNALLKTLEEPPAHAIFVLATTETHKVPATIISRCQRFDFRRVTPPDIAKRLQYVSKCENIHLHDEAASLIARHADGALRDALTLLEQVSAFSPEDISAADVRLVLGGVPQELVWDLMESIGAQDARGALGSVEKAVEEGASFGQLARDLTAYSRDLLMQLVGFTPDTGLSPQEKQTRTAHAQLWGKSRLEAFLSALREAEKEMRQSTDHRLLLELVLLRACNANFGLPSVTSATAQPTTLHTPPATRPSWRDNPAYASKSQPETPKAETPKIESPKIEEYTNGNGVSSPISNGAAPHRISQVEPEVENMPLESQLDPDEMAAMEDEVVESIEMAETSASLSDADAAFTSPQPEVETPAPTYDEEAIPESKTVETVSAEVVEPEVAAPAQDSGKGKKKGVRISNFEQLVELWPAVLMRIRKKIGVTAVAYLHDAQPVDFSDDEVVLQFSKEFHHAKATEASKRLPFEEKINETLDKPRNLRLRLAPRVDSAPAAPAEDPNNDDDDDDFGNEDIVDYTQSVFGADIIGRSG